MKEPYRIVFDVPGPPVGKARPRTRVVQPAAQGGKAFATIYTPKESAKYENLVRLAFREKHAGPPHDGPVHAEIWAWFPIPPSWSKRKREQASNRCPSVTTKPDLDNIAKAVLDGLNGVAFVDDKQVCDLFVTKRYSDTPRTVVVLDLA